MRKICENPSTAQRKYGQKCANKLRTRIADLEEVQSLDDLAPAGRPHPLKFNLNGTFSLMLADGKALIFSVDHGGQEPRHADGGIDRRKVTAVCIEDIDDYH